MNLRQMEVFRAFMLTGTVTDAAKLLGVSVPAVSSLLRHLQDTSGLRLFEPVRGRLLPTPEAKLLFAEVQTAWRSVEKVQRLGQDLAAGRAGTLRIAASTSLGTHAIPTVVQRMERDFPRLSVSLELFTPTLLVECLLSGEADVGAASYLVEHPGIVAAPVGTAPILCVMPRDHPLSRQETVAITDLADQPLVTHSFEMPEGSLIAGALRAAGVSPRPRVQVRSGQSACWFVRSGTGVALLDATTVAGDAFPDLVMRPVTPFLSLPIVALRSEARSMSKAAGAFRAELEAYCRTTFPLLRT